MIFNHEDRVRITMGPHLDRIGTITGVHPSNIYSVHLDDNLVSSFFNECALELESVRPRFPSIPSSTSSPSNIHIGIANTKASAIINNTNLGKPTVNEFSLNEMMNELYHNMSLKKCECGCSSIGVMNHSDYCPLYVSNQ